MSDEDIDIEGMLEKFASGEDTIDPRVLAEAQDALSEEQLVGMHSAEGGESDKLPLVESWFPESEEWQGKTIVSRQQAKALAVAKHLPEAFNEIHSLDGFIEDVINDYEMLLTSVEGTSREQQMNVLMALFGSETSEGTDAGSAVLSAIAGQQSEDNND